MQYSLVGGGYGLDGGLAGMQAWSGGWKLLDLVAEGTKMEVWETGERDLCPVWTGCSATGLRQDHPRGG